MYAVLIRQWLKLHPEILAEFEIIEQNTVVIRLWTPEKTKILLTLTLSAIQQEDLIHRLEGFL